MPAADAFFAGSPFQLTGYRQAFARLGERFDRPARERAARALQPTSNAARARLARWVEDGGAVVTTGQQAGLFGGPLYTVHKILTAVRLAAVLERELGALVLPVFWVASEDHDWAEVDHTDLVDAHDRLRRIRLANPADARPLPMSERRLDGSVEAALAELRQASSRQGLVPAALDTVEAAYRPGTGMATAFGELIAALFARFDLLITDAADPALKHASLPTLTAELDAGRRPETALQQRAHDLLAAGYHAQVTLLPGAPNLFLRTDYGRERLHARDGGFVAPDSRTELSAAALQALARAEPGRLSPNVLLRPVVESAVFPVLAYVGGPGEISYFAQLAPLFTAHAVEMPRVFPRASLSLVPRRIGRLLDELGLDRRAPLREGRDRLAAALVRAAAPPHLAAALARLRVDLTEGFEELIDGGEAFAPPLGAALAAHRNRTLAELARAEQTLLKHVRLREAARLRQLDRVLAHLAPYGAPQDRVLNVFSYLADGGDDLLHRVAACVPDPFSA